MADFEGDDAVESVRCFKLQLLVKRRVQFPFGEAANMSLYIAKMADFEVDIEVKCLKFLSRKVLELGVNLLLTM